MKKIFWRLIWLNHWKVYDKTVVLVRAVCRREGVRFKDITHLEVLQHGNNVRIRVNDRVEIHPEPRDFQTAMTPLKLTNSTYISGDISSWASLTPLTSIRLNGTNLNRWV